MMMSIKEYIEQQKTNHPQLRHASNLMCKLADKKLTKKQSDALDQIMPQYQKYLKENLDLIGYTDEIIKKRVELVNEYYNFFYVNGHDNTFTSQGKFRPTILEEFMFLLFKDYINDLKIQYKDKDGVINCGPAKAYTNLHFTSPNFEEFIKSPEIEINLKDQDFAIYRDFELEINSKKHSIRIPAVAIENKTYIDKTMLEGIIATAEKVKNGNPYSKFIVVSENYDVDLSVDPAYSRIDQIYVLRKCKRKEPWADIYPDVVIRFFHEVETHIRRAWSNVEYKMRNEGVII